ncbi:MAG: DUF362 domain-containing protein [Firmicutes bacterium]|nr:DUF362 domain-containing protein [Bacillota bacterium]
MAAKVYFVDMRANVKQNLLDKLLKLWEKTGFNNLITEKDLVAFKVHFGEKGNLAYIRPQYLRQLVDKVKELGGNPFLTDANTLYVGSRANAVDHIITAIENGWPYSVVGAPVIIADGLTGKDYINVPIEGKHFNEVKIGSAAIHADAFISVSHFKGHGLTGFGATIKNIGMGLGSRSGKQMMHSDVLPNVDSEKCVGCTRCAKWCPGEAIEIVERKANIIKAQCIGCGECTVTCPEGAIAVNWKTEPHLIQEKMAEYTMGVLKNKKDKCGFITFITQVSPECDCCGWNDAPIVRDIGIVASMDPIALDQAAIDLVNQEQVLPGSKLEGKEEAKDKIKALHPESDYDKSLVHGEELGLGTRKYELIKL